MKVTLIEVETKHELEEYDTGGIVVKLFDRGFQAHPAKQEQTYLNSPDPKVSERVRRETTPDGVTYKHTRKVKVGDDPKANNETERTIARRTYERLIRTRALTAFDMKVVVRKKRVHFYGTYKGYKVTVCLDRARVNKHIKIGRFVEFETMVKHTFEVAKARAILRELACKVLGKGSKQELRGYKTLALEAIAKHARRQRRKAKGK